MCNKWQVQSCEFQLHRYKIGLSLKGPSVTTKVSPEVVPEVRKCAETGLKPP